MGGKGYIGLGSNTSTTYFSDFWEYNPANDTWVQIANFPGAARSGCFSFVIGDKAYVGAGKSSVGAVWTYYTDFYVYDPALNNWTQLGVTPFILKSSTSFAINGKGYVMCGVEGGVVTNNVWEYNPSTDTWFQKSDFPGGARAGMLSFTTSTRAFVGTGGNMTGSVSYDDFWEYNYSNDTWIQKLDFPGNLRNFAVGVGLQDKWCIIMTGRETTTSNYLNDVWTYNIFTDTWTQDQDFPGSPRYAAVAFAVGNTKAYFGTGSPGVGLTVKDYWEYTPNVANIPDASSNSPVCAGYQLSLYASTISGATVQWTGPNGFTSTQQNPVVSASATTIMAGYYNVTSTLYGCTSAPGNVYVEVNTTPPATPIITQNGANLLSSSSTGNQWFDQNGVISGATGNYFTVTDNGSYYVVVSNGCGYGMSNTINVTNAGFENKDVKALVYPNPANKSVIIDLQSQTNNYFLQITNVFGQELKTIRIFENKSIIDLSEFTPGLYFLCVTDNEGHSGTYYISKQ